MNNTNSSNDILKLYTLVNTNKSLDLLNVYIEKIANNQSKKLKYIIDFEATNLDILFTTLKLLNISSKITYKEYERLDETEINFYLEKMHGLKYFTNQNKNIKTNIDLINYLIDALTHGSYVCNMNSTIRLNDELIVDDDWLISFLNFLISSLMLGEYISPDRRKFTMKTLEFPSSSEFGTNLRLFLKNTKIYEYNVVKKDNKEITYQELVLLYNKLTKISNYDFKTLKELNSELTKEHYTLSVTKANLSLTSKTKKTIDNLYNETNEINDTIKEFIKDNLLIHNRQAKKVKTNLIDVYEILRSLAYAYKNNYTLKECRKLFDLNKIKKDLELALNIARFYINYLYDEKNLKANYYYESLSLDGIRPSVIDYETDEYKTIIAKLSTLNKKIILANRKINKYLELGRHISRENDALIKENSRKVGSLCQELEHLVSEVSNLRQELNTIKDENNHHNNTNLTKVNYLKEAINTNDITIKDNLITITIYSKKDYHRMFHLEITPSTLKNILFSAENLNIRTKFYTL